MPPPGFALEQALTMRDFGTLRMLLKKGTDPNIPYDGYYPLHTASAFNDKEMVELLLDNGAEINACTWNNETSLELAFMFGRLETVELLLARGADTSVLNAVFILKMCSSDNNYPPLLRMLFSMRPKPPVHDWFHPRTIAILRCPDLWRRLREWVRFRSIALFWLGQAAETQGRAPNGRLFLESLHVVHGLFE